MIGRTGGNALILPDGEAISVARLRAAHESWLPAYMAGKPEETPDADGRP